MRYRELRVIRHRTRHKQGWGPRGSRRIEDDQKVRRAECGVAATALLTTRQPSGRETQAFKLSNLKWFNKNPRSLDLPGNKSGAILSDVQINY